jgi:hypothetical protein
VTDSDARLPHWLAPLVEELPPLAYFDAHTHLGQNDPDGYTCTAAQLLASLAPLDARAVVFPMHEPDGYPPANDHVLAAAAASDGRLVPFCRLDPHYDPVREATRCVAAGARGIKLHPRAEAFTFEHPALRDVFAFAGEHRLPVLIHAGRGIPALGAHALALAEEFPDARVILAHAAISDLSWIWRALPGHPNVLIDTSWWSPVDLLALFALVPPGQILFASDSPYGAPALGATLAVRCARQVGLGEEALRSVAGGQLERLLEGRDLLDAGDPPGLGTAARDLLLERVLGYVVLAFGRLLAGVSAEEGVALARLACEVPDDAPQAPVCRAVLDLLDAYERLVAELDSDDDAARSVAPRGAALAPLLTAACVAATPAVPGPG